MQIRLAKPSDHTQLSELESNVFSYDAIKSRQFKYLLTKANAGVFVAETNNIIAGYLILLFKKTAKTANLYTIGILSEFQNQGLAGKLMDEAESLAKARGMIKMSARTKVTNYPMQHLFKKKGWFQFEKPLLNYYSDGTDAFLLGKKL